MATNIRYGLVSYFLAGKVHPPHEQTVWTAKSQFPSDDTFGMRMASAIVDPASINVGNVSVGRLSLPLKAGTTALTFKSSLYQQLKDKALVDTFEKWVQEKISSGSLPPSVLYVDAKSQEIFLYLRELDKLVRIYVAFDFWKEASTMQRAIRYATSLSADYDLTAVGFDITVWDEALKRYGQAPDLKDLPLFDRWSATDARTRRAVYELTLDTFPGGPLAGLIVEDGDPHGIISPLGVMAARFTSQAGEGGSSPNLPAPIPKPGPIVPRDPGGGLPAPLPPIPLPGIPIPDLPVPGAPGGPRFPWDKIRNPFIPRKPDREREREPDAGSGDAPGQEYAVAMCAGLELEGCNWRNMQAADLAMISTGRSNANANRYFIWCVRNSVVPDLGNRVMEYIANQRRGS